MRAPCRLTVAAFIGLILVSGSVLAQSTDSRTGIAVPTLEQLSRPDAIADAGPQQAPRQTSSKPDRSKRISPASAANHARHEYGGRVLNVVLRTQAGKSYYRVKLLKGGRVRVVNVPAYR